MEQHQANLEASVLVRAEAYGVKPDNIKIKVSVSGLLSGRVIHEIKL